MPDVTPKDSPRALAIPGMHERLLKEITRQCPVGSWHHLLDLGAGQGAMSQRLVDAGYQVCACDMFPEMFRCPEVECRRADAREPLPYANDQFDAVVCVEVVEHLESQLGLFQEVQRILRPGGLFLFSTPNIVSLKSRLAFLLTGYFYSHGPLRVDQRDPVSQHIAAFTPDRYRFMLHQAGLNMTHLTTDKYQKSSIWLSPLAPLIWAATRWRHAPTVGTSLENSRAALFGRTMVGVAVNDAQTIPVMGEPVINPAAA